MRGIPKPPESACCLGICEVFRQVIIQFGFINSSGERHRQKTCGVPAQWHRQQRKPVFFALSVCHCICKMTRWAETGLVPPASGVMVNAAAFPAGFRTVRAGFANRTLRTGGTGVSGRPLRTGGASWTDRAPGTRRPRAAYRITVIIALASATGILFLRMIHLQVPIISVHAH